MKRKEEEKRRSLKGKTDKRETRGRGKKERKKGCRRKWNRERRKI